MPIICPLRTRAVLALTIVLDLAASLVMVISPGFFFRLKRLPGSMFADAIRIEPVQVAIWVPSRFLIGTVVADLCGRRS